MDPTALVVRVMCLFIYIICLQKLYPERCGGAAVAATDYYIGFYGGKWTGGGG